MSQAFKNTLFPTWTPPKYPEFMRHMKRHEKVAFGSRLALVPGPVAEAENDGLDQIIPLIVAIGKRPSALRVELGKAVWKQLHHSSHATNAKRARVWMKFQREMSWEDILQIRPCHLHRLLSASCTRNLDAAMYAGRVAPTRRWSHVFMLYRDCQNMGITVNPKWSLNRLQREHDAAGLRAALKSKSPTPWANPFTHKNDGYKFERLISDLDLAQEGFMQRHCIASYGRGAREGTYLVFRVTGKERATLGCHFSKDRDRAKFTSIQIKGLMNSSVSVACRKACKSALEVFGSELSAGGKQ